MRIPLQLRYVSMPKHSPLSTLRRIALHHQGLSSTAPFGGGKQATLKAIEHLSYVQIDTLAVVERAHHHTLWARIPRYKPAHLEQLLQERTVFEYWSHAAAFLPMRDYRFALPRMNAIKRGESRWFASVSKETEQGILTRIRDEGPLRARDFDSPKQAAGNWWNWKPAKKALEKLFFQGELMISSREGMQKVYDLRERVLPAQVNTREPSLREFAEYLLDSSLRAHGFTSVKQVAHLRQGAGLRREINALLQDRVAQGLLAKYSFEGLPTLFASPDLFESKTPPRHGGLRLLSPFDNAVIHRERLQQIFDFSYGIECYVPQAKRQFGYFCLPILYQDAIVGRADCKANRGSRHLDVLHLYIEKTLRDRDEFDAALAVALEKFAAFNGCETYAILKSTRIAPLDS